jgi:hypothetical protein
MDKLYGLRKLMKVLYPDVYFIIRMKKNNNYEIIVKGVKHIEYNPLTFHRILVMKNNKEVIIDNFINDITGFYPFVTEDNCIFKYLTKDKTYILHNP